MVQVIQMTEGRLQELLRKTAKLAATEALIDAGVPIKDLYSRSDMERKYGKGNIRTLINDGLINTYKITGHRRQYISNKEIKSIIDKHSLKIN